MRMKQPVLRRDTYRGGNHESNTSGDASTPFATLIRRWVPWRAVSPEGA